MEEEIKVSTGHRQPHLSLTVRTELLLYQEKVHRRVKFHSERWNLPRHNYLITKAGDTKLTVADDKGILQTDS